MNSDKVILAVSDVLYERERKKPQNRAKNSFLYFKIWFHDIHVGYHEKGNDGLYLDKDNLVLIE